MNVPGVPPISTNSTRTRMRAHVHEVVRVRWYTWYFGAKNQVSGWKPANQRGTATGTPTRELDLYREPELGFFAIRRGEHAYRMRWYAMQ